MSFTRSVHDFCYYCSTCGQKFLIDITGTDITKISDINCHVKEAHVITYATFISGNTIISSKPNYKNRQNQPSYTNMLKHYGKNK